MYKKKFKTESFEFNIDDVLEIAKKAGKEVLKIYNKEFDIEYKDDKSPLTEADKASHQIIDYGLKMLDNKLIQNPKSSIQNFHIPILSEEGKDIPYEERKKWEYFWMIDPLDGTKEFIKKNGEFTINIALIHKNKPIFGVVYAPVLDWLYFNDNNNAYKIEKGTIFKLPMQNPTSKIQNQIYTIVASKSHLNEETKKFIDNLKSKIQNSKSKIKFISIGSSLKLCLVAEGKADIYPRLAPTMEWDTAAADAIVRKAGKNVYIYNPKSIIQNLESDIEIQLLTYNKSNLLNPWFVVK